MTVEEFLASDEAQAGVLRRFPIAHVLEHMDEDHGRELLRPLPALPAPGQVGLHRLPPGVGYRSDPTHVRFTTGEDIERVCREVGLDAPEHLQLPPSPDRSGRSSSTTSSA